MTVIKPPDERHVCSPARDIVIKQYHHGLAAYVQGHGQHDYLMDYEAGTTLICDECEKVYTAEGWNDFYRHSAMVHRETASERKLRQKRNKS